MTPGFKIKHWWRNSRNEGESLKAFARRHAGPPGAPDTAAVWLRNKRRNRA